VQIYNPSLGYIVISRPDWAALVDPISLKKEEEGWREGERRGEEQ
jgi:hypothetical protein